MKKKLVAILITSIFSALSALAKDVLLDVRTPEEYSQGYLPGAVNVDVRDKNFRSRVSVMDREDRYQVYCKGGKRAIQAVTVMQELGFKHIQNLGGYEEAQRALKLEPVRPK